MREIDGARGIAGFACGRLPTEHGDLGIRTELRQKCGAAGLECNGHRGIRIHGVRRNRRSVDDIQGIINDAVYHEIGPQRTDFYVDGR